ncbi:MAG: HD-GYP domain-containing protein [Burkholderiales bacterium]|nr:HD-GYP domain-containing protein [Burkholderiales bacterium]
MLKRIPAHRLVPGMHLHKLCGKWLDHPFWRTNFRLDDAGVIRQIVDSGVREAWIDTAKGLDVADDSPPASDRPAAPPAVVATAYVVRPAPLPTTLEAEYDQAKALCRKATSAVKSLHSEARLGNALSVEDCLPLVDEISDSLLRNTQALISVSRLKLRDEYTYMHSVAVCALMVALGRRLGLDAELVREAGLAGLLHDMGKARTPLDVLNKPGKLTDAEYAIVRGHPVQGHALLVESGIALPGVLDVCLHHHEKIDGGGYPHRLKHDEISLLARMGAVCDVYDAITSNRPYKSGWEPAESLHRMAQWQGHFDPFVFQTFVKTVGIYPTGSLVRLYSGRLAVVTEQNPAHLTTPQVKVIYSTRTQQRLVPETIDLAAPACGDKISGSESPEAWGFTELESLWAGARAAAAN